jgi:zinc protease
VFSLLGVLLAAGLSPSIAAPPPAPQTVTVRATLANGLRVVVLPDKLAPVAMVVTVYGVGSDDDTMPGIAHATEHMMYRGTGDVSAGQFSNIADRMGAQYNAETSNEFTYYYFKLPSVYVDAALHLESDRMTGASMRASDWATERKAIEQEIAARQSVPGYAIGLKLQKLFYGDSVFSQASGGTLESFEKMTAPDIARFYRAWYHPNNATLVVAGDVDPEAVIARVHQLFDAIPSAAIPVRPAVAVAPMASSTISDSLDFPVGIAALMYRMPGIASPDYAPSLILNAVFNSGRGTMADLMTSGKLLLAYDQAGAFPELGASFVMGVPVPPASPKDAAALLSGAIDGYRTGGVPPDLIAAAKLKYLSSQAYSQASISGLALRWAQAVGQRETGPATALDAAANVGDADVNRVLQTYFTPDHQITVLLSPKPTTSTSKVDPKGAVESVAYVPTAAEALPTWAKTELDVPLKIPESRSSDAVIHLKNGLTVVVRSESVSPTVAVKGEIDTDPTLYQPPGREGVAAITSALLSWGTTSYDRRAYQTQLDAVAADVSLGTQFELTITAANFDRGMQLLADGILRPAFPNAGFTVIRDQSVKLRAGLEKLPAVRASVAETNALYPPGDPRRRRTTARSLQSIGLGDVQRWYAFAFRPDTTTIAIVGDVPASQARAAVEKYFGAWRAFGKRPNGEYPPIPVRKSAGETIRVKSAAAVQSHVTLKQVLHLHRGDADAVPLLLANTMLSSGGTGSLLFRELRTRDGYVYSVDSNVSIDRDGASFSIDFASDPKNVNRAQAAAVAIVKRMQRYPVDAVELQRAKALLIAQRVLPLDSYAGIGSHLLDEQQSGVTAAIEDRFWKAIVATTPAQIQIAMKRTLQPDRFLRVIVEPGA